MYNFIIEFIFFVQIYLSYSSKFEIGAIEAMMTVIGEMKASSEDGACVAYLRICNLSVQTFTPLINKFMYVKISLFVFVYVCNLIL